jgi:hypothetical protein
MNEHEPTSSDFERIEEDGNVFYSIFSHYDGEVLHLDPEQMQALQHWLTDHAETIAQDVQSR